MLPHFYDDEKAGVHSMHHIVRSSSISSRRSSSLVNGRSTLPRLMVGMSSTLCGPLPLVSGGDLSGATTVTSSPSGRRTPSSSTTTPFCTRPRATTEHLLLPSVTYRSLLYALKIELLQSDTRGQETRQLGGESGFQTVP